MGVFGEAQVELTKALKAYRADGDAYGEGRVLAARVVMQMDDRDSNAALRAARKGRAHADRHGFGRLSTVAKIDEGRALVKLGKRSAGLSALRAALSEAISIEDRVAQYYVHYFRWKAHEASGDEAEAEHDYRMRVTTSSSPMKQPRNRTRFARHWLQAQLARRARRSDCSTGTAPTESPVGPDRLVAFMLSPFRVPSGRLPTNVPGSGAKIEQV
jgi:hypothetical protein